MKFLCVGLITILAVGCAGRQMDGEGSDASNASNYRATVYKRKCASCHSLVPPDSKTASEWDAVLAEHESRVRLDDADRKRILQYLTGSD